MEYFGAEALNMKILKSQLKETIREVLSEARGRSLGDKVDAGEVAARMKAHKDWFGPKFVEAVAKKDKVSYVDLEKMFPDFIPGRVIISLIGR